jgi:DNA-binding transcriptional ArsR family regulator
MLKSTYHVFFRNLANPLRIKIITELRKKESSVNDLVEKLKVEQSKLSHALASLRKCKIVNSKEKGKQRIYSLNKKTIVPILNLIDKHAQSFCDCKVCGKTNCGGKK